MNDDMKYGAILCCFVRMFKFIFWATKELLVYIIYTIASPIVYILTRAAKMILDEDFRFDRGSGGDDVLPTNETLKCSSCDSVLDAKTMVTRYSHHFCSLDCLATWANKNIPQKEREQYTCIVCGKDLNKLVPDESLSVFIKDDGMGKKVAFCSWVCQKYHAERSLSRLTPN